MATALALRQKSEAREKCWKEARSGRGQSSRRVDNLEPRRDPLSIEIQKMEESKEGEEGRRSPRGEVPGRRVNSVNKLSKEVAMVFIVPRVAKSWTTCARSDPDPTIFRPFFETFDCWIDQVVDVCMVHRLLAFFKSTTTLRDLEPMIHFDRLKRSIVPCLFKPWKSCIY